MVGTAREHNNWKSAHHLPPHSRHRHLNNNPVFVIEKMHKFFLMANFQLVFETDKFDLEKVLVDMVCW